MRRSYTQDIVVDGTIVRATLIEDPNIDDVLVTEARVYGYSRFVNTVDPERRVDRNIRDLLLRFGVAR